MTGMSLLEHRQNRDELPLHLKQRLPCRLIPCRLWPVACRLGGGIALFQLLLRPGDGEAFGVEELLDAQDDVDLALGVEALPASALVRRERGELRLPIAKDVRLHVGDATDF